MASSIVVWQAQLQVWQAQLQGAVRNRPSLPSLREFYLQMACGGLRAVASRISTQYSVRHRQVMLHFADGLLPAQTLQQRTRADAVEVEVWRVEGSGKSL